MDWHTVDWVKLGDHLRDRMRVRGITQMMLAEELAWSRALLVMVLRGHGRISAQRMKQLLAYLELSEDEIPCVEDTRPRSKGNRVFISYSHHDKEYLDRLMVHHRPIERQGIIDPWVDTRLLAGDKWKKEIESGLNDARVAILLVSADFLASDFIIDNELPPLLQAAGEKGTLIIPVILKPCRFVRHKTLREFQSINPPDEPVILLDESERELVYDSIAQRIEEVFDTGG